MKERNLEVILDPFFFLMSRIILQGAGLGRHLSQHVGIASVYNFPNAIVTNVVAGIVAVI